MAMTAVITGRQGDQQEGAADDVEATLWPHGFIAEPWWGDESR